MLHVIFQNTEPNEGLVMGQNEHDVSRRDFLQRLSIVGVAGIGGSTLLSACGGGSEGQGGGSEQTSGQAAGPASADLSCDDLSALSDAQQQQRSQMAESLNYIEQTENPEQNCANCALYEQPEDEETTDNACGGCQLFPGPVHPNGYCTSWAPAS